MDEWPKKLHLQPVGYHGGDFIGGDCRKLLESVDDLARMCPLQILPFVQALRDFRHVVVSCFGMNLKQDYKERISAFAASYSHLGISTTPKVHIVTAHVADFCKNANSGLGPFSEQAFESVHHVFQSFWARRLVRDIENPSYSSALLKTVAEFNSKHI